MSSELPPRSWQTRLLDRTGRSSARHVRLTIRCSSPGPGEQHRTIVDPSSSCRNHVPKRMVPKVRGRDGDRHGPEPVVTPRPIFAFALLALCVLACKRTPPEGTKAWFESHREKFETLRKMLEADHGLVRSVQVHFFTGRLMSADGTNGSCIGDQTRRGGGPPWDCSGHVVANSIDDVERFLGVPAGRLRDYEHVLYGGGIKQVNPGAPAGSVYFFVRDSDTPPCKGVNNVLWSPTAPSDPSGPSTVARTYLPLGGGWYEEDCR